MIDTISAGKVHVLQKGIFIKYECLKAMMIDLTVWNDKEWFFKYVSTCYGGIQDA